MISFTFYWALVGLLMLISIGMLIYAYLTGDAAASPRLETSSPRTTRPGSGYTRLLPLCRKSEATWRLPGARVRTRSRRIGLVGVSCRADYDCRFGEARSRIAQ